MRRSELRQIIRDEYRKVLSEVKDPRAQKDIEARLMDAQDAIERARSHLGGRSGAGPLAAILNRILQDIKKAESESSKLFR